MADTAATTNRHHPHKIVVAMIMAVDTVEATAVVMAAVATTADTATDSTPCHKVPSATLPVHSAVPVQPLEREQVPETVQASVVLATVPVPVTQKATRS